MAMLLHVEQTGADVLFVGSDERALIAGLGLQSDDAMPGLRTALATGQAVQLKTAGSYIQVDYLDSQGNVDRTESTNCILHLAGGGLITPMDPSCPRMEKLVRQLRNQARPLGFLAYVNKDKS
jgi:hypothetical protein